MAKWLIVLFLLLWAAAWYMGTKWFLGRNDPPCSVCGVRFAMPPSAIAAGFSSICRQCMGVTNG
jgi:hypothetical protein